MEKVSYNDFKKIDLCIGIILNVDLHPHAEKLYVLKVNVGEEDIQLVAGLRPHYNENELIGKQIVVVRNLQSSVIRGVESQGMLLAAVHNCNVRFISPEKKIANGATVE